LEFGLVRESEDALA
jgi:hypothetical protein